MVKSWLKDINKLNWLVKCNLFDYPFLNRCSKQPGGGSMFTDGFLNRGFLHVELEVLVEGIQFLSHKH